MINTDLGKISCTPRGEWSETSTYDVLDIVEYQYAAYVAKTPVPMGTLPTNTGWWMKLVRDGDVGGYYKPESAGSEIRFVASRPDMPAVPNIAIPNGIKINDTTPSGTEVYSSEKIEEILAHPQYNNLVVYADLVSPPDTYQASEKASDIRNFANGGGTVELHATIEGAEQVYGYEGYDNGAVFRRPYIDSKLVERITIRVLENRSIVIERTPFSEYANPIKDTLSGSVIVVDNSINRPLLGLNIYGKTIQDGIPTPDAPVELVNAGASGSIEEKFFGRNILPDVYTAYDGNYSGIDVTINADHSITVDGTATAKVIIPLSRNNFLPFGNYTFNSVSTSSTTDAYFNIYYVGNIPINELRTFESKPEKNMQIELRVKSGATVSFTIRPFLSYGNKTEEEQKPMQTLTIPTPNGLPGIPVESGGNYTDEAGQQWITDEIDFERGVYIKRIASITVQPENITNFSSLSTPKITFFNTNIVQEFNLHFGESGHFAEGMCNRLVPAKTQSFEKSGAFFFGGGSNSILYLGFEVTLASTVEEAKSEVKKNKYNFLLLLKDPEETPLSAELISAYKQLHSNYPYTTIFNDSGAGNRIKYIVDTKSAINEVRKEIPYVPEFIDEHNANPLAHRDIREAIAKKAAIDDSVINASKAFSSKKSADTFGYPINKTAPVVAEKFIENYPLEVISKIEPKQEGSGDPSPENVRNIVPWTGAKLSKLGINLFNPELLELNAYGDGTGSIRYSGTNPTLLLKKGMTYGFHSDHVMAAFYLNGERIGNINLADYYYTPDADKLVYANFFYGNTDFKKAKVWATVGDSIVPYEPYNGADYTMQFGQDVYGGEFNWETGELSIDWQKAILTGQEQYKVSGTTSERNRFWIPRYKTIPTNDNNKVPDYVKCNMYKPVSANAAYSTDIGIMVSSGSGEIGISPAETYETAEAFKAHVKALYEGKKPIEIVYKLVSPIKVKLSPTEILALNGVSTLYSDTGDTQVIGAEAPNATINKLMERIATLESKATNI